MTRYFISRTAPLGTGDSGWITVVKLHPETCRFYYRHHPDAGSAKRARLPSTRSPTSYGWVALSELDFARLFLNVDISLEVEPANLTNMLLYMRNAPRGADILIRDRFLLHYMTEETQRAVQNRLNRAQTNHKIGVPKGKLP